MSSQIFKIPVPKIQLFELLDQICTKTNNYYIFNKIAFKKCGFINLLQPFIDSLMPNYYKSKQFYLTRKQTCSSFATIIRQLCKLNNLNYTSKIHYTKSTYDIIYNIYF
jgi:hypothetical protein